MEEQILALLRKPQYIPLTYPELLKELRVQHQKRKHLSQVLAQLEKTGAIARIKGSRYALSSTADLVPGRLRVNRNGSGFVQPDDATLPAIWIPADGLSTAMHGDRVLIRRDVSPRFSGNRPKEFTGVVSRILEKVRRNFVGTLRQGKQFLYVVPDDQRMRLEIIVPPPRDVGRPAQPGDKVVVELGDWDSPHRTPEGEIIEVLGPPDGEGVDMLSVIRQYNLTLSFPKNVLHEARQIGTTVLPGDAAGRIDCRSHAVVTIDPDDAKDFDDAIFLRPAGQGNWHLWVHIADVSHYVKPGSALDVEAEKRGNSTYLVDRVIPMLPEALSNELCSLKSDVDRLTKCVEFLLSPRGEVLNAKFYSAIIRSKSRYTYKQVYQILQHPPTSPLESMLHDAHIMAQKIRVARFHAGSLDLDFPETKIILDAKGAVLRIDKIENDISHQLIEEYMLLANEAVATRLMALNRPALYRIHESPEDKRLQEYREEVMGHRISCGNLTNRREVQKLLEKLNTISIGPALKIGFLKSLMRARYAVEPMGHYGLAKKKYTHFTSPIRRYADLVVHRALFGKPGQPVASQPLPATADHISETERNSADAERDSRDVKLYAYLNAQLQSGHPTVYPGLITDVRNFGFFVDVKGLGMSGLIPLSGVSDDFYIFDPRTSRLTGRRTRRTFQLGDKVEVQIAKVDKFKHQVDFKLAGPSQKPATRMKSFTRPMRSRRER